MDYQIESKTKFSSLINGSGDGILQLLLNFWPLSIIWYSEKKILDLFKFSSEELWSYYSSQSIRKNKSQSLDHPTKAKSPWDQILSAVDNKDILQ